MTKTQDYTAIMKDMMGAFPVDMSALQGTFKTQATLAEKMSKVGIEAAEKSAELSTKWTKDTLAKFAAVTAAKAEPTDYAKAFTDFATTASEAASEHMAAFAEVAKKFQMETVELMLAAGKNINEETTAAVKKVTSDVTSAATKAAAK